MIHLLDVSIRMDGALLEGITFEVPAGGCGVLVGREGSGATAIAEAICGLRPIERGVITLCGEDVTNLHPADRGVGYVPAEPSLYDSLTVRENLMFGLEVRKWKREDIRARVAELAAQLGLSNVLENNPAALSAGEARRASLGRAVACRPAVLCLDEPLAGLDGPECESVLAQLEALGTTGITILHVARHGGVVERLADRLFHLENGRVLAAEK